MLTIVVNVNVDVVVFFVVARRSRIISLSHCFRSFSISPTVVPAKVLQSVDNGCWRGAFCFLVGLELENGCHEALDALFSLGFAFQEMFQSAVTDVIIMVLFIIVVVVFFAAVLVLIFLLLLLSDHIQIGLVNGSNFEAGVPNRFSDFGIVRTKLGVGKFINHDSWWRWRQ